MARKRPASEYAGALAKPIYPEDHYKFTGGLGQATKEPDIVAIRERGLENMGLLFEHYEIDPNDEQRWLELAMSLAFAHVPGLQFANRPKPGRKTTWKTGLGDELVRAVEDVQSPTGVGIKIKDALLKLHVDKLGRWKDYTVENLDVRYREARARQKVLASLREAWLNEIATAISSCEPSATPPPLGRLHEDD